jgi:flagellar basal body-associated protein FliL
VPDDPKDNNQEDKAKSHWLLWFIVAVFLVFSIVGMWSIDYFFSPEARSAHQVRDAVDD